MYLTCMTAGNSITNSRVYRSIGNLNVGMVGTSTDSVSLSLTSISVAESSDPSEAHNEANRWSDLRASSPLFASHCTASIFAPQNGSTLSGGLLPYVTARAPAAVPQHNATVAHRA